MSKRPLQVGLVGFGKVAERFHAPLITCEQALQLKFVVERHRERARELYPGVTVLRSIEEMLQKPVDLVVVLTPNDSHYDLARKALLAGKHVVVDKPMTVSSEEADELIAIATRKNRTLSVFHNRRWDSDFLTLRSLLKDRALGRIVEIESRFDRFRPQPKGGWREDAGAGTGVLYDLGSHLLDQALVLFGSPRALWADIQVQRDGVSADDWFRVLLDYPDIRMCLRASCLAAGPMTRFCVRGTKGTWIKLGLDSQEMDLADGKRPGDSDWGIEEVEKWGIIYSAEEEKRTPSLPGLYTDYYRLLAQSLQNGGSPPVGATEARDVVRGIELCLKSCQSGGWQDWA